MLLHLQVWSMYLLQEGSNVSWDPIHLWAQMGPLAKAVVVGQLCEENAPAAPACDYWLAAALGLQARERSATAKDGLPRMTDLLRRIAQFFRDESCGQCVPCRLGTVRQEELLGRLLRGTPIGSAERELALLDDIAVVARDASICGLGQTAVGAAQSAVKLGLIGGNGKEPV